METVESEGAVKPIYRLSYGVSWMDLQSCDMLNSNMSLLAYCCMMVKK
jgi:hypothetical protein